MNYLKPTMTVHVFDKADLIVASGPNDLQNFAPGAADGQKSLTATIDAGALQTESPNVLEFK